MDRSVRTVQGVPNRCFGVGQPHDGCSWINNSSSERQVFQQEVLSVVQDSRLRVGVDKRDVLILFCGEAKDGS